MSEKKSIQDLADNMANVIGGQQSDCEKFLQSMFTNIVAALETDGIVKIKGLGTFKLIQVDERKSVNVQNGDDVIIPAHKKVTFTPDKNLKESINAPYAHLQTYVLNPDAPLDPPEQEDDEDDDLSNTESADSCVDEVLSDNKESIESEQNETVQTETENLNDLTTEVSSHEDNQSGSEETTNNEKSEIVGETENVNESKNENNTIQDKNNSDLKNDDSVTKENPLESNDLASSIHESKPEKKNGLKSKDIKQQVEVKKNKKLGFIILFCLVVLVGIIFIVFTLKPNIKNDNNGEMPPSSTADNLGIESEFNEQSSPINNDTVNIDTIKTEAVTPITGNEGQSESDKETIVVDNKFDGEFVSYMKRNHPEVKLSTTSVKKVVVERGQTLRLISLKYYNDKSYSVYLYLYNKNEIKAPNNLNVGQTISVPVFDKTLVNSNDKETLNLANEVMRKFAAQ